MDNYTKLHILWIFTLNCFTEYICYFKETLDFVQYLVYIHVFNCVMCISYGYVKETLGILLNTMAKC